MPRILAFDYGLKRTGLAVTDQLKMIASPLGTIPTAELADWLAKYCLALDVTAGDRIDTKPFVRDARFAINDAAVFSEVCAIACELELFDNRSSFCKRPVATRL